MELPCKMCKGCNLISLGCEKDCVTPTLDAVMDDIKAERQAKLKRIERWECLAIRRNIANKINEANLKKRYPRKQKYYGV